MINKAHQQIISVNIYYIIITVSTAKLLRQQKKWSLSHSQAEPVTYQHKTLYIYKH